MSQLTTQLFKFIAKTDQNFNASAINLIKAFWWLIVSSYLAVISTRQFPTLSEYKTSAMPFYPLLHSNYRCHVRTNDNHRGKRKLWNKNGEFLMFFFWIYMLTEINAMTAVTVAKSDCHVLMNFKRKKKIPGRFSDEIWGKLHKMKCLSASFIYS